MLEQLRMWLYPELQDVPAEARVPVLAEAITRAAADRAMWPASLACAALAAGGAQLGSLAAGDIALFAKLGAIVGGAFVGGMVGGLVYGVALIGVARRHLTAQRAPGRD